MTSFSYFMLISKEEAQELLKAPKPKEKPKEPPREYTFWDDGRSLLELREVMKDIFWDQSWYENEAFAKEREKPCMRTIRILSVHKTVDEHKSMLEKGEDLVKARQLAMLSVLLKLKGEKPIDEMVKGWIRCSDKTDIGYWANVKWYDGRLNFYNWPAHAYDSVASGSARTSS